LILLLMLAVPAGSCGGAPPAPSAPSSLQQPVTPPSFRPGAYYLGIGPGHKTIVGPGGEEFQTTLCMCIGTNCPTSLRVPVDVESVGDGFSVRAVYGTLRGSLLVNGVVAAGTLRGAAAEAEDGRSGLSVQDNEVSLSGTVTADRAVNGTTAGGSISLYGPAGCGGCSAANWSLSAR
jgi:hypothetical protein